MSMTGDDDHCFVVPAYGNSEHLDDCLRSLREQHRPARILIATSTPNAQITAAAGRYGLPVHVNEAGGGIGSDWNFALSVADARWVTLAHQDDVYLPNFSLRTLEAISSRPTATLAFCNYTELEGTQERSISTLLRIKRVLLELGFVGTNHASCEFFKVNTLRFGCAIPCPAVTLNTATGLRFRTDLQVDLDWAAWLWLARQPGTFVYIRENLMQHRVHAASETSSAIDDGRRVTEDKAMLHSLWPGWMAAAITGSYRIAYRNNRVTDKA